MRGAKLRRLLAGPLLALCLVPALLAPATASAGTTTAAGIFCTTYKPEAGTAVVRFGYENGPGGLFQSIAAGDENYFSPAPPDRGQLLQFVAGVGAFDQTLAVGSPVSWSVHGTTATADLAAADLPFERPCPERGPSISAVTPTAAAPGSGTQLLTIFGQGLAGATVSVSGSGVGVSGPIARAGSRWPCGYPPPCSAAHCVQCSGS